MAFLTLWTSSVATWILPLCGGLGFDSVTGLVSLGGYVRVLRLELLVPRGCSDICRWNLPPGSVCIWPVEWIGSPSLTSPSDSSPCVRLCKSRLMPIKSINHWLRLDVKDEERLYNHLRRRVRYRWNHFHHHKAHQSLDPYKYCPGRNYMKNHQFRNASS